MPRIDDFLNGLQTATTLDEVSHAVTRFRDEYGTAHAIYHVVGDTGREYGAFTYDMPWVEHYISESYGHIDPSVLKSLRSFSPVNWADQDWSAPRARTLMHEAVENGVGKHGLSVPVRGANGQLAMFSVSAYESDDAWGAFTTESTNDLLLAAHYLHVKSAQIMGDDYQTPLPNLSPRERDALTLLSVGSSRAEAAEKLQISEHTLRVYVDSARTKLGAMNTTHAVALALTRGLILP